MVPERSRIAAGPRSGWPAVNTMSAYPCRSTESDTLAAGGSGSWSVVCWVILNPRRSLRSRGKRMLPRSKPNNTVVICSFMIISVVPGVWGAAVSTSFHGRIQRGGGWPLRGPSNQPSPLRATTGERKPNTRAAGAAVSREAYMRRSCATTEQLRLMNLLSMR